MSRPAELTLAAIIAAAGIAAMIWWPADDTPSSPPAPAEENALPETPDTPDEPVAPEDPVEPEPPAPPAEPVDESGDTFTYMPPGDLVPDSGTGRTEQINFAPGMRFPMEAGQAYANSQVYGHGGFLGPDGGQCDPENYSYAWRDNFCETRGYDTPMCPAGTGHQGQDIRPATCQDATHWAVAAVAGTITSIGSYSVRLTSDEGVRYTYLHLERDTLDVEAGDRVEQGQRIGLVSNEFGGNATTIHLHFEIRMAVETGAGLQNTSVPPYLALVDSYERLLDSEAG